MTKKEKRASIISLIMTSVALLFAVISISYSWYTITERAKIDEMSFGTQYVLNVRFKDTDNSTKIINSDLPSDFEMSMLCGNGVNFYSLKYESNILSRDLNSSFYGIQATYDEIIENFSRYFEEVSDTELRKKAIVTSFGINPNISSYLTLDSKSYIEAPYKDQFSIMTSATTRVAILESDHHGGYDLKVIWFPNAYTTTSYNSLTKKYSIVEGDLEDKYYFFNMKEEEFPNILEPTKWDDKRYINTDSGIYYKDETSGVLFVWGAYSNEVPYFTSIDGPTDFKQIIWAEGNDLESNSFFGADIVTGFKGRVDIEIIYNAKEKITGESENE